MYSSLQQYLENNFWKLCSKLEIVAAPVVLCKCCYCSVSVHINYPLKISPELVLFLSVLYSTVQCTQLFTVYACTYFGSQYEGSPLNLKRLQNYTINLTASQSCHIRGAGFEPQGRSLSLQLQPMMRNQSIHHTTRICFHVAIFSSLPLSFLKRQYNEIYDFASVWISGRNSNRKNEYLRAITGQQFAKLVQIWIRG